MKTSNPIYEIANVAQYVFASVTRFNDKAMQWNVCRVYISVSDDFPIYFQVTADNNISVGIA